MQSFQPGNAVAADVGGVVGVGGVGGGFFVVLIGGIPMLVSRFRNRG